MVFGLFLCFILSIDRKFQPQGTKGFYLSKNSKSAKLCFANLAFFEVKLRPQIFLNYLQFFSKGFSSAMDYWVKIFPKQLYRDII